MNKVEIKVNIREITENDFFNALECIHKSVDITNRPDYPNKIIDSN
jgi:hypothetical protein